MRTKMVVEIHFNPSHSSGFKVSKLLDYDTDESESLPNAIKEFAREELEKRSRI